MKSKKKIEDVLAEYAKHIKYLMSGFLKHVKQK